jgi:hypothetical protein
LVRGDLETFQDGGHDGPINWPTDWVRTARKHVQVVEPHVQKRHSERAVGKQPESTTDVVGIDMGDDEQLERPVVFGQVFDTFLEELIGRWGPRIDDDPVHLSSVPVFNPQGIPLLSGEHFDTKH